jgi:hypothetical protein
MRTSEEKLKEKEGGRSVTAARSVSAARHDPSDVSLYILNPEFVTPLLLGFLLYADLAVDYSKLS